eukprot:9391403-Alexandrium_andersonii.AAC.1
MWRISKSIPNDAAGAQLSCFCELWTAIRKGQYGQTAPEVQICVSLPVQLREGKTGWRARGRLRELSLIHISEPTRLALI